MKEPSGLQRLQCNKRPVECPQVISSRLMGLRRAGEGLAEVLHWTDQAHRLARRAHGRPKIHQRLVEIVPLANWNESLRQLPEVLLQAIAFGISLADENPVQHTAHIGVEDRGLTAEGKAQHGSSRIAPDAFQAL